MKSLTNPGFECSHNANDQQRFNPNSEGILGIVRFILSCFLAFESKTFWVLWRIAEAIPRKIPAEASPIPIGVPTPVLRVATAPISSVVITVTTVVLEIFTALARRLNCLASLDLEATSSRKKCSSSSIF